MQAQGRIKVLAAFLSLSIFFLCGGIYAHTLQAHALDSPESLRITTFEGLGATPTAGDYIKLLGSNFGTETSDLKINLAGETYDVYASYGNEIEFELDTGMRSGDFFVVKTIEEAGIERDIASNRLYLELEELDISKVNAPGGMLPGQEITLSGRDLDAATFWCAGVKLDVTAQDASQATVVLPNDFAGCHIKAVKNKFEFETEKEFLIATKLSASTVFVWNNRLYVHGKNFQTYEDSLDAITLVFEDGTKLSNPIFVSDNHIYFEKNNVILPNSGKVALAVDGVSLPMLGYEAHTSFPHITEISNLQTNHEILTFTIKASGDMSGCELKLNGLAVERSGSTAKPDAQPHKTGTAWLEKDGWKSSVFHYEFEHDVNPVLSKLYFDAADTRIMHIQGLYFEQKRDDFEVFSEADLTLVDLGENSATLDVNGEARGDFSISVSSKWGNSNVVPFTLPGVAHQFFYPVPSISTIETTAGFAPGEKIYILGSSLLQANLASFAGENVSVKVLSDSKVEVTIPSNANPSGTLFVINKNGAASNELDYTLTEPRDIALHFPLTSEISMLKQSEDWQDVVAFQFENNQKPFIVELMEINYDHGGLLPLIDYRIVDAKGVEIEEAQIDLSAKDNRILLRNLAIPYSEASSLFTVQVKVFEQLEKEETFHLWLNNVITETSIGKHTSIKTVAVSAAEVPTLSFCQEVSGTEWQRCRTRVRRPDKVRRPTSDVASLQWQMYSHFLE